MSEFDGIVLAGGKSKRMGMDKSEIVLDGKSFLQIQADKLKAIGAENVFISGKSSTISYVGNVMDIIPDMGPLGGLYSCFLECKSPAALVLSVDVPLISSETLTGLLNKHFSEDHDATLLSHDGRIEPLIAVYKTDTTDILKELINCNSQDDLQLIYPSDNAQ